LISTSKVEAAASQPYRRTVHKVSRGFMPRAESDKAKSIKVA
jgi:hypothetical protein